MTSPRPPGTVRKLRSFSIGLAHLPEAILTQEEEFITYINTNRIPKKIYRVEEYCDRMLRDTVDALIKVLRNRGELKDAELRKVRLTLTLKGVEVPVPEDALGYAVEELPDDCTLNVYLVKSTAGGGERDL